MAFVWAVDEVGCKPDGLLAQHGIAGESGLRRPFAPTLYGHKKKPGHWDRANLRSKRGGMCDYYFLPLAVSPRTKFEEKLEILNNGSVNLGDL